MKPFTFPLLALSDWKETRDTLQKYCRMVGAIREAISIPLPYSYQTNLKISDKGFTTSRLPKKTSSPELTFEVVLDLEYRRLVIESNFREPMRVALTGQSLNALCDETCSLMVYIGIAPPLEKPSFLDGTRGRFDAEPLLTYWKAVSVVNKILNEIKLELGREAGQVQLRPDDLSLNLGWFCDDDCTKNSRGIERVEFGFSTGDEIVPELYFYVSAFPEIEMLTEFYKNNITMLSDGNIKRAVLPQKN